MPPRRREYCGSKPRAEYTRLGYSRLAKPGTCFKKGFTIARAIENSKHTESSFPRGSLLQINGIGEVFEKKFNRFRFRNRQHSIKTVNELASFVREHVRRDSRGNILRGEESKQAIVRWLSRMLRYPTTRRVSQRAVRGVLDALRNKRVAGLPSIADFDL